MSPMPDGTLSSNLQGARRQSGLPASRLVFAAMLALAVAAPALAQGPPDDRPQKRNCSDLRQSDFSSKADWINARIDCRTENLNVEAFTLVDHASGAGGIFTDTQIGNMMDMRGRAEKARKRSKEAGGFKGLGRKQKTECSVQEYDTPDTGDDHPNGPDDGDNDGVCTNRGGMKENCAELAGDSVGDDDGVCETTGNRKEACVEICDSALNDQDDDNFDDQAAEDMEGLLENAETMTAEANRDLAEGLRVLSQARRALVTSAEGDNRCEEILKGERRWLYVARGSLILAVDANDTFYDICDSMGNQDVVGNNISATCIPLAIIKGITHLALHGWEIAEEILTEQAFDRSLTCLEQQDAGIHAVQDTVGETQSQLGETNEKIVEIEGKIDAQKVRIDEIIELLKTAPGRRPDFPKP